MASFYEIINNRTRCEKTQQTFQNCSVCNRELRTEDLYVIAKAFSRGACIMEAVQCLSCQMESRAYASQQSMENITLYSGRRFNDFLQDSIQRKTYHLGDPSCLITGEMLSPADSFELYCFNIPDANLDDDNFLFVGPTAMEQMSELLSEETRKSWGRFTETLAPESPENIVSPIFIG